MIDITGTDLVKFAQEVYALSQPQGLGIVHYRAGELDAETARRLVDEGKGRIALSMDYVRGRACKMTVYKQDGRLEIRERWFDHSDEQLTELLRRCNIIFVR